MIAVLVSGLFSLFLLYLLFSVIAHTFYIDGLVDVWWELTIISLKQFEEKTDSIFCSCTLLSCITY